VRLDLTEAGRALLKRDPLGGLIWVIASLPAADRAQFLGTLSRVASAAASLRPGAAFGTCLDCSHFTPAEGGGTCACMAAHLAADEITQLCGSYRGPIATYREHHGIL